MDFLYTIGFVASFDEYHGTHVPSPICLAKHCASIQLWLEMSCAKSHLIATLPQFKYYP